MKLITDNTIDLARLASLTLRPALYERSEHFIWTDDHVGRKMLDFHLDPELDSASLKHTTIDGQVAWIAERVKAGGALLDIGCGPGLYCERFAQAGLRVRGMDFNRHSLAYATSHAKERGLPIEYVHHNYVALEDVEAYDAVTLINRDFGALTPGERVSVLAGVHRALVPGGLFFFDTLSPKWFARLPEHDSFFISDREGFWAPGPHLVLEQRFLYPRETAYLERQIVIVPDGITKVFHNWLTCSSAEALAAPLADAGFEIAERNPFLSDAIYDDPELYVGIVARKV